MWRVLTLVGLALATLLFCGGLVINRAPLIFNDTQPYLSAGRGVYAAVGKLVQKSAAATSSAGVATGPGPRNDRAIGGRSPFYGIFAWGARAVAGSQGIVVLQALWLALAVVVALPRFGLVTPGGQVATIVALGTLTILPFFVAVLLPDVFGGIAILGISLLWVHGGTMRRPEWLFWLVGVLAASLFHRSFLMTGTVLLVVAALAWRGSGRARLLRAAPIAGVLALALSGSVVIESVATRFAGHRVTPIPFLLARTIGDGTAARVLRDHCPAAGFYSCRYVPILPLTENQFLWGPPRRDAWFYLPTDARSAVSGEQSAIVGLALREHPIEQVWRSAGNAVRQLFTLNLSEFEFDRQVAVALARDPDLAPELAAYDGSRIVADRSTLAPLATFYTSVYLAVAAFVVGALLLRRRLFKPEDRSIVTLAGLIVAGIFVSAAVNGVLAGVMGRYGSRASWLVLLAAVALMAALHRRRGRVPAIIDQGDLAAHAPGA